MAIPPLIGAIFPGTLDTPFVQVEFGSFVSQIVLYAVEPPCFTFTGIVVPAYPVTGISILIGLLKKSGTFDIPNLKAHLETCAASSQEVTVSPAVSNPLASKGAPQVVVISVPDARTAEPPPFARI